MPAAVRRIAGSLGVSALQGTACPVVLMKYLKLEFSVGSSSLVCSHGHERARGARGTVELVWNGGVVVRVRICSLTKQYRGCITPSQ